jgi:hypothetical protein
MSNWQCSIICLNIAVASLNICIRLNQILKQLKKNNNE